MPPVKKVKKPVGKENQSENKPNSSNPRLKSLSDQGEGVTPRTDTYGKEAGGVAYGKHALMPVLVSDLYAEVQLPDLQEFDPSQMKLDATIVAVGKRRTGKTWVFRNIMYQFKDKFSAGLVISQTDELNKFWRDYVPKKYIFNRYDPEILQAVFRRQKKILNDVNKTEAEKDKEAPFFILLDDVISDNRLKYDEALMELFVAGRHYRLFVLITTQYAKAITPTLRGNTDYCFMMKCLQQRQLEALWEDFGSFLTKDAFAQIINAYTEDNEVLIVNTCPDTEVDPLSMLGWWKAEDPGPFHMGTDEFWRSAELGSAMIPPRTKPSSATELMNVKDIMPMPWRNFPTERGATTIGRRA
jgi:hypothetical protein